MECRSCAATNDDDSLFCESCGAELERTCDACGATRKPSARFCRKCGHSFEADPPTTEAAKSGAASPQDGEQAAVRPGDRAGKRAHHSYTPRHLAEKILSSKAALEGERKEVTVLFADVKSSMELSEQLDPEDWHIILDRFFEILTEGVHRFEGNVNQYTGDGIMALFGAPIAHEDHANRACYAALYLRDALKQYTDSLRAERGLSISVRMGINTGEVIVGKIGDDLRMDYTAQGHTVGLAQRMESLAEPGSALLAENTIKSVEGYFALRDLGKTRVKGVEQPVRMAELEGVGEMRTRFDRSRARGLSKFVGRHDESQRLEAALARALEGDGQVVGVVANAGAGKSRLCYEFLESCRSRGIRVNTSTGVPHGQAVPLQPVLELYREIFGISREDDDAQARQKIAGTLAQTSAEELEHLPLLYDFLRVPDSAQPAPQLSEEDRGRELMELLRRLTAARSRREPAVIVFEDLHWVDPQTNAVIEWIVDAAASTRTLFVVNFRPEYRADWMSRTHYQQISLSPLDASAAGELLADWLGPDPSLVGFAELVRDRTGGNPFFMEEVVQAQIESGALVGSRGHFRLEHPVDALTIPSSVQNLLAARIDRLEEQSKRLLQAAAVLGDDVVEVLLADVSGIFFETLRDHIHRLVQGEFLYEASLYPDLGYAFKHPLTREVAYGTLLRDRRRELHAAAAQAIETRAGDAASAQAPLLAHHWEEAGRALEAARWQKVAGERLGASGAVEALYHWGKVIELLTDADESPEARQLRGQARARMVYAASRSAHSEEDVAARFAEAQQDLGDEDSRELGSAIAFFALARNGSGHPEEADSLISRAIAMARRLEDRPLLALATANSCVISGPADRPDMICSQAEEVERLCADDSYLGADFNLTRPVIIALCMLVRALEFLGRMDDSDVALARLIALAADTDNSLEQTLFRWSASHSSLTHDDLETALEHSRIAVEHAGKSSNEIMISVASTARGDALFHAGRIDEALEQLERARTHAIDHGTSHTMVGLIFPNLSGVHIVRRDVKEAIAQAQVGIEVSKNLKATGSEGLCQVAMVHAQLANRGDGNEALAEAALLRATQLSVTHVTRTLLPLVASARAALEQRRGNDSARTEALNEAIRLHHEYGELRLERECTEIRDGG